MADLYHALADSTRRSLLDRLYGSRGLTLTQLCEGMPMSRQAVTKHLAILEEAELVSVSWYGRCKRHYLNPVPLREIVWRWIGKFEDARIEALSDLKTRCEADPSGTGQKRRA